MENFMQKKCYDKNMRMIFQKLICCGIKELSDYALKIDGNFSPSFVNGKDKLKFYTGDSIDHKQLTPYISNLRSNGILYIKDFFNDEGILIIKKLC